MERDNAPIASNNVDGDEAREAVGRTVESEASEGVGDGARVATGRAVESEPSVEDEDDVADEGIGVAAEELLVAAFESSDVRAK